MRPNKDPRCQLFTEFEDGMHIFRLQDTLQNKSNTPQYTVQSKTKRKLVSLYRDFKQDYLSSPFTLKSLKWYKFFFLCDPFNFVLPYQYFSVKTKNLILIFCFF
jgi:hypothetical protein